jgi:uncharacterized protein (TIGR04255 family)
MITPLPPPLGGPPPIEISLPQAPLVRVIAQVRFPLLLTILNPATVAAFQETIRSTYPILEEEQVRHLILQPASTPELKDDRVWRFKDRSRSWRVSLATGFVALETTAYHSRQDFLGRLRAVVGAVETTLNPQEAQRIGLRYIDRLTGPTVDRFADLIKPEVLGVARTEIGAMAQHLLTEALFPAEEGQIRARWGHLPANATIDPEALEPVEQPSWLLDLDMFRAESQPFATNDLLATATSFAQRVYSVFRWMVTDEFLRFHGGQP